MNGTKGNTYIGCIAHLEGRTAVCECGKTIVFEHKIDCKRGEAYGCRECVEKALCRDDKYMPLFAEKSFRGTWNYVVPCSNPPYGWMSRWHIEEELR